MKNIEASVSALVEKYSTNDPFRLCSELGINCFIMPLPESTDGVYYSLGSTRIIIINEKLEPSERRITAAHELGHVLLHPESNYLFLSNKTFFATGKFEREADYFAACLLLNGIDTATETTVDSLSAISGLDNRLVTLWANNHTDLRQ